MAYTPFSQKVGPQGAPGRPTRINKPVVMRAPEQSSGFEWSTVGETPDSLKAAKQNYIDKFALPPALQSSRRSSAMQQRTNRAISAGWRKPRGAA